MANLQDDNTKFDPIYQIEKTDLVEGGPDGIANKQAQILANRTAYLQENKVPYMHASYEIDVLFDKTEYRVLPIAIETNPTIGSAAGFSIMASTSIGTCRSQLHIAHIGIQAPKFYVPFSPMVREGTIVLYNALMETSTANRHFNPGALYIVLWVGNTYSSKTPYRFTIDITQLYGFESMTLLKGVEDPTLYLEESYNLFYATGICVLLNSLLPWTHRGEIKTRIFERPITNDPTKVYSGSLFRKGAPGTNTDFAGDAILYQHTL